MRLIDADALIAEMHNVILEDGEDRRTFYEAIQRQPTIDAVPVVRCKDCVNFEIDDAEGIEDWCAVTGARTAEDGYCAWGERKAEP